jgi:hypothetical protein
MDCLRKRARAVYQAPSFRLVLDEKSKWCRPPSFGKQIQSSPVSAAVNCSIQIPFARPAGRRPILPKSENLQNRCNQTRF